MPIDEKVEPDFSAPPIEDPSPPVSRRDAAKARQMSLKQLAAFLNRDRNTVQKYLDQGMPFVEKADRDRGASWVIDSAEAVRWLEERSASAVADKAGNVRAMTEDEAKAQQAVYKMISAGVAAAEDVRMVAKIADVADLIRSDYTELRLRLSGVSDTVAAKVDPKISAKVRLIVDEQIRAALLALTAESKVDAMQAG
ncbi:terminase small subunit [Rhizobium ruizarguesonis]|uniref:terminase small subunit n=1 Tax=Rhizobium ruizarguesonis TaxID=2081791 RepID=UPI0013EE564F|nr:terminase small subunit [Rhizobium ruizarguesonis]